MQLKTWACGVLAMATLVLSGCESEPEDIQKWKANNNTAKLIKTLDDGRQFMRLDAIDALKELQAADAIDALGALLDDYDVVVVHKSIEALAAINDPAAEKYMLRAIAMDTDPARLVSARSLGNLKSTRGVDPLIVALDDEYENVAVEAAVSLGKIGEAKALPALGKSSSRGSVRLRGASVASIRQIGGSESIELLFAVMGDESTKVRNEAIAGLVEQGEESEDYALKMLRSANNYERQGALAVLEGHNKVPTSGNDLVWYKLADLAVGERPEIQRPEAQELAEIENSAEALIEALAHPNQAIREHAFIAIETVGERAAEQALAAAAGIKPEASEWLSGRSTWAGAPAWELDLWGAATALNPNFKLDERQVNLLMDDDTPTVTMLKSKEFKPRREIIPYLIRQMAATGSDSEQAIKKAENRRTLAFRKLRAYKTRAKYPLIAALNDNDLEIAAHSAKILVTMEDDSQAINAVVDSFATRVEAGENLHNTPFYDAMLELDMPGVEALVLKVRPNPKGAMHAFKKKYPGTTVSNMSMPPGKLHPTAEPFRLKYLVDGRTKEMKVIFRPNEEGDWVPDPAFPDELPQS